MSWSEMHVFPSSYPSLTLSFRMSRDISSQKPTPPSTFSTDVWLSTLTWTVPLRIYTSVHASGHDTDPSLFDVASVKPRRCSLPLAARSTLARYMVVFLNLTNNQTTCAEFCAGLAYLFASGRHRRSDFSWRTTISSDFTATLLSRSKKNWSGLLLRACVCKKKISKLGTSFRPETEEDKKAC